MTRKIKKDTNVLASLGSRPKRTRTEAIPPSNTPSIPKSISDAFGFVTSDEINNQPLQNLHFDDENLNDDPNLAQFMPYPEEPEIEPQISTAADQFAQESQDYWNSEAREREKHKWSAIESQMTATYLECQHQTKNWTSQASYLDADPICQCPDKEFVMQTVDLFDQSMHYFKKEILFCSCMPRPVRLLHYGYIASSTQFPHTAFSIPLLQFHHHLWNQTVVSSTGFLGALIAFLNSRTDGVDTDAQTKNTSNKLLIHNRDLRRQFSHSVNTYRSIMLCTKRIYSEGLKLSNAQLLADRCARCFGPAINEKKISPQEPDVIIALDGNFQHRHYTRSSKDNPTEEEYPNLFVKPSSMKKNEIIQNSTEGLAKNMKVPKWLLRRLRNAHTVSLEAWTALTNLSNQKSTKFPTITYTKEFLRQQWLDERNSQNSRCHIQEQQKIELGRLLYYQEMAQNAWDKDASNTEEGYTRLEEHSSYKKKIEKQRAKIGSEAILKNLNAHEQDQILKIWYAKQEVRDQFVAICEQKRPLDMSRRDGKHSSIGYNDKTPLLKTLRDQAAKLKTKLESYQKLLTAYSIQSPHQSQPPNIMYTELLKIDFDHSFWNDGLFTNGREPWAIDANTQHGMRQIAYFDRANEEIRRIGWEVQRVMRWATDSHKSLYNYLFQLQLFQNIEEGSPMSLPLVEHPTLSSLSRLGKVSAAQVIINEKLARLFTLQVDWNGPLLEVFARTPPQDGDRSLRTKWHDQIKKIQNIHSKSAIVLNPGIITILEKPDDDIQMENQEADEITRVDEPYGNSAVYIYEDSDDEPASDEDNDIEEEDVDEALNGFSCLSAA
ncbi:uncharacterized protein MELLADRAFT_79633 [Melampsora larici-populina 98AG31]|uniref:CxC1-like cysteine cluster associated with KDZ transposases domain-containing protein n=1 Tax=Melampsora larici-populina (strain 98AG31 / pathotype 3-4-7) TaxID=747676 RepID=F4S9I0_MELLP|nr:uncharacterized protein MELLADRAFT_79633 [Melampsora larici-populina 98AG31]EGF98641.1 hypothetical protein MELLADRAFT_79633 [Melampsora larici-populina 98AG31]